MSDRSDISRAQRSARRAARKQARAASMRRLGALVTSAMAIGLVVTLSPLTAAPASAAPGDPFDPSRATVFVAQSQTGASTTLYRSETSGDGSYAFQAEGGPVPGASSTYNAIGFSTATNYIYGVSGNSGIATNPPTPGNAPIRIGQEGIVTRLGTSTYPQTQWSGAVNPANGWLYSTNGLAGTNNLLYAMNPANGAISTVGTLSIPAVQFADFEFYDGFLWGIENRTDPATPGTMVRIDPVTAAVTRFVGVLPSVSAGSWGAAWTFGNGNMGFSNNGSGMLLQLSITDSASANPTFDIVTVGVGESSNLNDGTAIPGFPVDLGIVKSTSPTFIPGNPVSYTVTVTNHGEGESSGWHVSDTLPAQLTAVTATAQNATCTVADDGTSIECAGGRLAVGATETITITGQTSATDRSCFTNTAGVIGNELDPNEANDSSSASTCARLLSIDKQSDATANTRVGDTVNYTITATNTGAGDYTAADPAFVFDDLTGVLDDATFGNDLAASKPGSLSFTSPRAQWSGALAAGETVELTYSVVVKEAGDGTARNVAWEPKDPGTGNTPSCDAPVDGHDATTGEPCAVESFVLPKLTISKAADKSDLPVAGESVTYTITVSNVGPGEYTATEPATFTDDLSAVLDDATIGTIASSTGTSNFTDPTLSWSGALAAGASATVTYTVVYTGEGDQLLDNLACIPTSETAAGQPSCDVVNIPGARLNQWKSATPSSDPLVEGSTIEYTLFFENTGQTDATVEATDNLTHVLDDAQITTPAASNGLNVELSGENLLISGSVPAGETYTVTYTVTILPAADRGDSIASNFLLKPGQNPPTSPECVVNDPTAPDCTSHPITGVTYEKSVTASATPTVAGTQLTYSILITNTGAIAAEVNRDDNLIDVLDDADITTPVASSNPTVTATGPTDGIIELRGTIAQGETATVTYTVTVKPNSQRGNNIAANFVVPPGQTPDPVCDPASALCTSNPIQGYSVTKSADKSTVVPGETVTYTVTVTNTGALAYTADAPAGFDDDLSAVTDDATYNNDITAGGSITGDDLSWEGPLAVGETVVVTYSFDIDNPVLGDGILTNAVIPTEDGGDCDPVGSCETVTKVQSLTVSKVADTVGVLAGDVVTYTVIVTNTGQVDYAADAPAAFTDDLTDVLDDATLNDITGTGLVLNGTTLEWASPLAVGESRTVTYSVTVNDPLTGDKSLRNAVVTSVPGGSCDEVIGCEAETGVASFTVNKSVNAQTVLPGGVVTYEIDVVNTGEVDYTDANPASFTDSLGGVFDDAQLSGSLPEGATLVGNTLTWSGALALGETITVTYSVVVDVFVAGDFSLKNEVVPSTPGGSCDTVCETVTPIKALHVEKSTASTEVVAGDQVDYEIVVTNIGQADYTSASPATFSDDLIEVLDDATYNNDVASSTGSGQTYDAGVIGWTGPLAVGASVTITYSVTISDPITGDHQLLNTVVTPPEVGGNCAPDSTDPACAAHVPAASFDVAKNVDKTVAVPGDTVTYSVTVTNTGSVDYTTEQPAAFTDDLSRVLDDAAYNDDATNGAVVVGTTLEWSGALAVGESITVTYSVTIDQSVTGDYELLNVVRPTGPGGVCLDGSCTTETDVAAYTVAKISDSVNVVPGGVVTYTVEVTNIGAVAYDDIFAATFVDDLSSVLDDATYNDAVIEGVTFSESELNWTGSLPIGERVTVTYSVTVNNPATGDGTLINAVLPTGPGGSCEQEGACVTETPVLSYSLHKSVDVASALPGDVVTYTITATNTGQAPYTDEAPATFSDDLTAVLDDATYNDDATNGAVVDGTNLTWSGAIAAGESVSVSYSVTVNDPIEGDQRLDNVVVPSSPGGVCAADGDCTTSTPVASYTVTKLADKQSALPGEVVTYTVTVTNTSEVDYTDADPATFSDDLSGVLDDASYNADVSEGGSVTGNVLIWSGAVAAGESVSVTYSVTVNDPIVGDFTLNNAVTPTAPGGSCEGACETTTPLASFHVVKSTESTEVVAGNVVSYEIVVTNTGAVDYTEQAPASFTDDLARVLDDSTYNDDVASSAGTVSYDAGVLSWSGALLVGESVSVTYSVTVADVSTGDQIMENVVVTPPGSGANCAEGSTDPDCIAVVDAAAFSVEKSVDVSSALSGDIVTYTIIVRNTGAVAYTEQNPASFVDDLSRVLDDAEYNGDVSVGGSVTGTELTWAGALAIGESVDVTYSVTVNTPLTGDNMMRNIVRPSAPGGTCVADECATETPVVPPAPVTPPVVPPVTPPAPPVTPPAQMPVTGAAIWGVGGAVGLLLAAGGIWLYTRSRREQLVD